MIQDPKLYAAMRVALDELAVRLAALDIAHWKVSLATWNEGDPQMHLVLASPGQEKIMCGISSLIDPANDGAEPAYVAPPEFIQFLDELREEEGATITFAGDNPDFNGEPNAVITVNASWTHWRDQRVGGVSVLECLREAVRLKRGFTPTSDTAPPAARDGFLDMLAWQFRNTVADVARALRKHSGNLNHPDVKTEIRRLDALDAVATAYGISIPKLTPNVFPPPS